MNNEIKKLTPQELAKRLMKEIMYDNGMVDRWNTEQYPQNWVDKIAGPADKFFNANPHCYTDEDIENICAGEYGENQLLYSQLEGYAELEEVLNEYFDGE